MAHVLIAHPDTPPQGVQSVEVVWHETGTGLLVLRWRVRGKDALALPPFAGMGRADGLWQATCFELFLKDADGAGYREFNFSPSHRWAAYRFAGYRDGMAEADCDPAPEIAGESGMELYVFTATLARSVLAGATAAGLSAVLEEKDGTKSYWALAHPPGRPDFHHPACFTAPVAAPPRP